MVEEYIEELLKAEGYEHASFTDPVEAIRYLAQNADRIDLLISDIRMPVVDGFELAKKAVEIKGGIGIILLSGYSEKLPQAATLPNVRAVLDKPLLKTDLIQAVKSAIGGCK